MTLRADIIRGARTGEDGATVGDVAITLGTLIVGGFLTQVGAWLQRRWRRMDDAEERAYAREAQLKDALQGRVDRACEALLDDVAAARSSMRVHNDVDTLPEALHAISERMERSAVVIPDRGTRERAELAASIMWFADEIATGAEEDTAQRLAWRATNEISHLASALLRREGVDPPPSWYGPAVSEFTRITEGF